MRKIGFALFILTIALASCKKTKKDDNVQPAQKWTFEQLKVEKELFPNKDSIKGKGMDLNLEFNYPSSFENDSVLKFIRSGFVVAFAGEDYKDKLPAEAFELYGKAVETEFMQMGTFAIEDGPDISNYFKHIATTVADTTDITITAKTEITDYTGGAHGSRSIQYYNIDSRSGKIFKEAELFNKDSDKQLTALLGEEAKTTKNGNGDTITLLEPEAVVPNGNFYFGDEGIVYVYNQYEIAPYSDGLIEITLPYEQIKALISPDYEPIVSMKVKTNPE